MLQSRRPILAWLAILAVAGVAQPRPSFSQTADKGAEIPEIVVTAQHRVENVQDIPIAITALTSDTLAEHHVSSVMDLAALAPGLDIRRGDNSAVPKIFLRGVGSNDFNPTTATAVGMYQNGIYIASPLAQMGQFFDVERVEVLRGPQGTLYGRNTTGGAINIITRKPTKEFEADTSVETGNYHSLDVEGGVGGPLIRDALAARAAIRYIGDSGYMTNALTGRRGNDAGQWASRLSFLWTSGPNFTADFILNYGENHGASIWGHSRQLFPATAAATDPVTGFCAAAYFYTSQCSDALGYSNLHSNVYVGDYAFKGRDVVKAFGAGATLTWDLGDVSLISTTGLLHTTRNDLEATDDAPDGLFQSLYVQKAQTWSEELRLQNHEGGPAKWVTGLYYAHDYNSANSYYNILAPLRDPTPTNPSGCDAAVGICDFDWPNSQRVNSWAAFGQLDYTIVKDLTGTLGVRFSQDQKHFIYNSCLAGCTIGLFNLDESKKFNSTTGRLGVQYALTSDANLWFTYNRGAKSGGFFSGQTTDPRDLVPYSDEKVNAYELGLKSEWFDHRLRTNVSAFYDDYKDMQVFTLVVRDNITVQTLRNASNARIYGADFEVQATPIDHLNLTLSAEALSAKFVDFVSASGQYSGNVLPAAPKASLTAAVGYEIPHVVFGGHLTAEMDARYRSLIFFETRNFARLSDPARTWVNCEFGWKSENGKLEYGVWGRNIFNTPNIIEIDPIEGLGEDEITAGKPRTYGLYIRGNFK